MNPLFKFPDDSYVFSSTFVPPSAPQPQFNEGPSDPLLPYHPHPVYNDPIDPALASQLPLHPIPQAAPSPSTGFRIKLPPFNVMAPTTRGASRQQPSSPIASGSEYHESNASMEAEEPPPPPEDEEEEEPVEYGVSSRGRRIAKKSYIESASEDDPLDVISPKGKSKQLEPEHGDDEEDDEEPAGRYALRNRGGRPKLNGFIVSDEEDGEAKVGRYATRNRTRNGNSQSNGGGGRLTRRSNGRSQPRASSSRSARLSRRRTRSTARNEEEDGYVDEPSSGTADGEGSMDEAPVTSPEPEPEPDADGEADAEGDADLEPEQDGKPYALRQRAKINYAIPPPLEEMRPPPKPRPGGSRSHRNPNRPKPPGWSATGAELSRWMGGGGDDSVRIFHDAPLHALNVAQDSDFATRTPRKQPFGGIAGAGGSGGIYAAGGASGGGFLPGDLAAAAGTPSNLGKVSDTGKSTIHTLQGAIVNLYAHIALADADPLGVNQNVTFDEVGGLDERECRPLYSCILFRSSRPFKTSTL